MAPIVSGTMVAVEPIELPTINRVTGINNANKIINGMDRNILLSKLRL